MTTKAERRAAHDVYVQQLAGATDFEAQMARGAAKKIAHKLESLATARVVDADRRKLLRRSVSRWARFQANAFWFPFGLGMAWLGTGRLFAAFDLTAIYVPLLLFFVLPLLATVALVLGWSVIGVRRDLARERAWQDALPYELSDYEECLGDAPTRSDDRVHLLLTFVGDPPRDAELLQLLGADDGTWTVKGAIATRAPGPTGYSDKHNLRFAIWFHAFTDVLARVDQHTPLLEVRLLNQVWEDLDDR